MRIFLLSGKLFLHLQPMRVILLSLICICGYFSSPAQAFLGLYAPDNSVTQIRENPAFALHDDRAQLNFGGIAFEVGGNSLLFKKHVFNFLTEGKASMDKDYFRNHNDQPNKMFWAHMEVIGPGAAVRVKKRYYFALTTGMRYLLNSDHLDDRVFNLMGVNPRMDSNMHDSFTIKNYSLTSQVFSEINLSYAGYFYNTEEYKLVGGVTLKLLNGISAAGMGIPDATFKTYNHDGNAYSAAGIVNVAFTPNAQKWAISNNPLIRSMGAATNNMGIGADIGVVYYMNPSESFQVKKGYVNRFSLSVTDIGSINYTASSTSGSYLLKDSALNYRKIQNNEQVSYGNRIFNDYLIDSNASPRSSTKKMKVGLPTALRLNADFRVDPRIFVNVNVLVNLRQPSADVYNSHYTTTFTVTPRYVIQNFGVSLPFSFNVLKQGYMGVIVFYGPVYIGSGSLWQLATSNSINNLNLFLGAHLRIKPKKQKEKDMMML